MKTYDLILITTLITLTTQIKTEMSNKIKKSKTLQTTYGDIITIESIRFEEEKKKKRIEDMQKKREENDKKMKLNKKKKNKDLNRRKKQKKKKKRK